MPEYQRLLQSTCAVLAILPIKLILTLWSLVALIFLFVMVCYRHHAQLLYEKNWENCFVLDIIIKYKPCIGKNVTNII